jgi:hypothetical protein
MNQLEGTRGETSAIFGGKKVELRETRRARRLEHNGVPPHSALRYRPPAAGFRSTLLQKKHGLT